MLFALTEPAAGSNSNILGIATQIKTPLMLAGLALLVLLLLFKSRLTREQSYMVFFLALVAEILSVVAFMLPAPEPPSKIAILDGTVFSPKNSTKSVPQATVYLAIPGHPIQTTITQDTGYYAYQINREDFGKQAKVYVIAKGYKNSPMFSDALDTTIQSLPIYLDADSSESATTLTNVAVPNSGRIAIPIVHTQATMAVPPSQADLQTCLSGDWKEVLKGRNQNAQPNVWRFSLSGETLTAKREDDFALMSLKRFGDDYKGDLTWQTANHDVWHNIALTPSSDCQAINTNLQWAFTR